ncbi:hypothetical protein H0H87_005089 [Tephrocybe sp. NHM501043]|nr:hypothetical protein H0H87_005089 [Tephrocybe sp. NHM501043]
MKAVPDNFYSTPGPFDFNHYLPAQVETNFEDEEVEVVVEEEQYDGDIPANLEEDNDFEDHNDTTLRAILLGDLKFDLLQAPETSSISRTESQDIHQYAHTTPPPPRLQHIHSTATQHGDNLVEADPFNITPLTSQYLVPSPYPADDSSQSTFGHMHAPPQWALHSQAAPQPMYPPSTSQQSQMPSQQPILQAPHPQATRRTLAPMPPGFVESTSNLAINAISKRLDATGITTIGASLDTLQEHRRRNNRSKLPCPEDLLALSALRQSNNPALPLPPMSSQGGCSVQAPLLPSWSAINYLSHSFSLVHAPFCNQALQLVPTVLGLHPPSGCTDPDYTARLAKAYKSSGKHLVKGGVNDDHNVNILNGDIIFEMARHTCFLPDGFCDGPDNHNFTPRFPKTTLALILCAIEYALDCLIAGIKLHFRQEVYESIYQKYIGFMREYTQNKGSYLYHQFILTCSQLSDLAKSQPATPALVDSDSLLRSTLVPNPITPPGWTPPDNSLYDDDSDNE